MKRWWCGDESAGSGAALLAVFINIDVCEHGDRKWKKDVTWYFLEILLWNLFILFCIISSYVYLQPDNPKDVHTVYKKHPTDSAKSRVQESRLFWMNIESHFQAKKHKLSQILFSLEKIWEESEESGRAGIPITRSNRNFGTCAVIQATMWHSDQSQTRGRSRLTQKIHSESCDRTSCSSLRTTSGILKSR